MLKYLIWTLLCTLFTSNVLARLVTEAEVRTVATNLLAEPLFRQTFPLTTIKSVEPLESVWCVNLSPKGHLLISGTTACMPLLAYSKCDFQVLSEDHPATAMLRGIQSEARIAELANEVTLHTAVTLSAATSPAEKHWEALLSPSSLTLFASDYVQQVGPLLKTGWTQRLPYNDLTPQIVEGSSTDAQSRAALGCVATMYMQIMNYHAWPARLENPISQSLSTTGTAISGYYDYRLQGGQSIDWTSLQETYSSTDSEDKRYAAARVGLLAAMLAKMNFTDQSSGAQSQDACNNQWYDYGTDLYLSTWNDELQAQIVGSLDKGLPLPTNVPGHAVVTDGYAIDTSGNFYVHLNYGWGGLSDGFYLMITSPISWMAAYHAPKLSIQAQPLPSTITNGQTMHWSVPAYHQPDITGFTVTASPVATSMDGVWQVDPSDASTYIVDGSSFSSTTADYNDGAIDVLQLTRIDSYPTELFCVFSTSFMPSIDSEFACSSWSEYTHGYQLDVQINNAQTDGWETLVTIPPCNDDQSTAWAESRVSLGQYAGLQTMLRLRYLRNKADPYTWNFHYRVGNITVSNVYSTNEEGKQTWSLPATAREHTLTNLEKGKNYAISIQPQTASGVTCPAWETSVQVSDSMVQLPQITAIQSLNGEALVDGTLLAGALTGKSGVRITCNEAVATVRVYSSCLTLIPDTAVTVHTPEQHVFDVVIDSTQTNVRLGGSRLILTIEATNAAGDRTYRDIVLALRTSVAPITYDTATIEWELTDGTTVSIPHQWFQLNGLVSDDATEEEMLQAAAEDDDKDGFFAWQEFLCGTSPTNATERLQIYELTFASDGTLEQIHYTPTTSPYAEIRLEGAATLEVDSWSTADPTQHRFFRLRAIPK